MHRLIVSFFLLFISLFYGSVSAQSCPQGDANNDCKTDGLDYVIWLNHYNKTSTNGSKDGDFNNSGLVEGLDYVIWLNNYGNNSGPSLTPPNGNKIVYAPS